MEKGKGNEISRKMDLGRKFFNEKQLTKSEEVPKVAVGTTTGEELEV